MKREQPTAQRSPLSPAASTSTSRGRLGLGFVRISRVQRQLVWTKAARLQESLLLPHHPTARPAADEQLASPEMAPAPSTLVSPLKQVNADPALVPRKPKLQTSWDKLTQDPAAFAGQSTAQIASFFAELFCLTPTVKIVEESLDRLEITDLLGPYKVSCTR